MASPVVTLDTPDLTVFKTLTPKLEFTGSDADGDGISYTLNVYNDEWSSATSTGVPSIFSGVAYANGAFYAVTLASASILYRSYDGINWEDTVTISSGGVNIGSAGFIEYFNGLFIAGGGSTPSGRIWTSSDAVTWTNNGSNLGGLYAAAYGNGLYVVVGNNGNIFTSPDGATWTKRATPNTNYYTGITYGGGKFVVTSLNGTTRVLTSDDGITWTERPSANDSAQLSSVAYGNGVFVITMGTGLSNQRFMTSPDGITWTLRAGGGSNMIRDVIYTGRMFLAAMYSSSGGNVGRGYTSPDGITWSYVSGSTPGSSGLAYMGGGKIFLSPYASPWNVLHKFDYIAESSSGAGFEAVNDSELVDPFPSGEKVSYTLQSWLEPGEYSWKVAGIDPSGDNTLGSWSGERNFTVVRPVNPGAFFQLLR